MATQPDFSFADWTSLPHRKRIDYGQKVFQRVQPFLGRLQARLVETLIRTSEERDFFIGKMVELESLIGSMPGTYEQRELGMNSIAHLHYFTGGADWWIIEKDKGHPEDDPEDFQAQMYGYARFAHMPEYADTGYISLPEIIKAGAELDFHWKARTLAEIADMHAEAA
jgi:hypothetical protein